MNDVDVLGSQADRTALAPAPAPDRHESIVVLGLGLLIATLWLATRPYFGIVHDSRFYTVQVLRALTPERFADDLYFQYGSQDQFTLFTQIYKPFVVAFGLTGGNMILLLCTQVLWLTGLIHLARGLIRDGNAVVVAIATAIVLPGGAAFFVRYGEPQLTPRLMAEALTLWGIGSMLRGRSVQSLLLLFVSMTIHPIMTLPGATVAFVLAALKRPALWLIAPIGLVVTAALALGGIEPFTRLLTRFDSAWFGIVLVRDWTCFLTEWDIVYCAAYANALAFTALVMSRIEPEQRRLLGIALAVALCGPSISILGGDLLRNVLIVDMQQWRATWLLTVVSNLLVGPMLLRLRQPDNACSALVTFLTVLAVGLLALSAFLGPMTLVGFPAAVIAWFVGVREKGGKRPTPAAIRLVVLAATAVVLGLGLGATLAFLWAIAVANRGPDVWIYPLSSMALIVIASMAVGKLASADRSRGWIARPAVMLCLAIVLTTVAGFLWDRRTAWTTFVDTTETPPQSLTSLLPADRPVFFEDVTIPWLLLKRSNYFSCSQGTGALFSRGTAMAFQSRMQSFRPLGVIDLECGRLVIAGTAGETLPPLSRNDLSAVCQKEPELGALVLTREAAGVPVRIWKPPVGQRYVRVVNEKQVSLSTDRFFIYSCSDVR